MPDSDKVKLQFPDGSIKEYQKGVRPKDIIEEVGSHSLKQKAVVAKLDGKLIDLDRPIHEDSAFRIVTVDDPEGMETFWHSTSHIMAHAVKELYPEAQFGVGPPIENGFYYDIDVDSRITSEDLSRIENKMREIIESDTSFQRDELSKAEAIELFKHRGDPYKLELLEDMDDEQPSIYKEGDFVDLCRGPHIPSTGKVKSFKLLNIAGAYWRGDENNKMLQRIYGISFPKKKQLDEYLRNLEEAKKRDHRKLGKELELFLITPKVGGGLPLWLPKGTIVRETLENFLRDEQRKRGYLPVVTPHIGSIELYKTSGHYPYYRESQFDPLTCEGQEYLLKPMNCPHHFQIYSSKPRSYRDLPVRFAEFGTVYRYEQSGELNGIIRVRSFTIDDAHMFVRPDQLKDELNEVVDLIKDVFRVLGFKDFKTQLSFRDPNNPEKYGGNDEQWEKAQQDIQEAAEARELDYHIELGEAAFYGPKIDFMIRDVLGRSWQLGTVQVDYVMPERFNLEYVGNDNQKHRPVVIHRAPFGSMERFIGILIEHFAGAFPVWLAPVQAIVLPISDEHIDYAKEVRKTLRRENLRVELDERNEKIGFKIREAEMQKIPYMLVVGKEEAGSKTVAVRKRKQGDLGKCELQEFKDKLNQEIKDMIIN
ncbi:threonine--tRNA ligase [candidate division KSB1 bacterium]|nr:threonine--tRNA ligase [candidate division KSB1 bacterium]NIR70039.1 threonine--tRNA ligase [candidate division KSB1 bacterium]NIS24422.1 threonine--tRNA ligase [candidate division KSB1 bacterium]NIT71358.1 threonine--tRNA ligase [candidate division KSB1 bacterium]NIU25037.1 threonine--tRNA ligase [candidate division KSB1 bacterium]